MFAPASPDTPVARIDAAPAKSWVWTAPAALAAALCAAVLSHWQAGIAGDALWHLADGRWILAHGAIPRTDPFGWADRGVPWVNLEWGWDALSAILIRAAGSPWGLFAWPLILWPVLGWAQWARWGRLGASPRWRADLLVPLALLTGPFWAWRPQIVSYTLAVVWWAVLEAVPERPRRLWILPPLLLAWEQLHAGYLLALVSTGVWLADQWIPGDRPAAAAPVRLRAAIPPLAACAAALGLTPWGFGAVAHAIWESRQPSVWRLIVEWASPDFHSAYPVAAVGVPALILAILIWRQPGAVRRVPRWHWLLLWLTLGMTLLAIRNAPFWAISWATVLGGLWPGPSAPLRIRPAWGAVAAVALAAALAAISPALIRQPQGVPSRILAALRTDPGRVLNDYRMGDALVAAGIPDSLDGRTDLWIAAGAFPRLADFEAGLTPWPALAAWLHRHHVRWILWRSDSPGTHEIAGRPGIAAAAAQGGWILFAVRAPR